MVTPVALVEEVQPPHSQAASAVELLVLVDKSSATLVLRAVLLLVMVLVILLPLVSKAVTAVRVISSSPAKILAMALELAT